MIKKIKPFVQISFLLLFLLSMLSGKAQIWMAFIFLSIVLAGFFGRFYCGWACPINTFIRPVSFLKKKMNIGKSNIPTFFKSQKPRTVTFIAFIIGLAYTIHTITQGRKFPLPLIIIPMGILATLFINEQTWHRYLCPWGTLFSFTSRFSKYGMKAEKCTSCISCVKSCPTDVISVDQTGVKVDKANCLLCFECTNSCPVNTIKYSKL
ncbi:4Fe-4S binding protein [Clostridium sediminicola]|uniref:4Fe-4S binding protein n=1 Tax=Clostridium sediminicola TaxID=3114879 RepID=UPI0031F22559